MPLPKGPGCAGCPAEHLGRGFVPGEGPPDPTYVLIGQGPGEHEYNQSRPFVGPSGARLDGWLAKAGIQRSRCWVDNIVRCALPKNRPGTPAEVAHCTGAYLRPLLGSLPGDPVLVWVGLEAGRWLLGPDAGELDAGTVRKVWVPLT